MANGIQLGTALPFRPSRFANLEEFGPERNLIGTSVLPGENAIPLSQLIGQQAAGLVEGPDRGALAAQTFNLLRERTEPQFQMDLQNVGRQAAALGRIGSGVTTSQLGDVVSERERALAQAQQGLSLTAAGQTLQDRQMALAGLLGASGQLFGQQAALRGELRGERGFQTGLEQQAFQNLLQQRGFEEGLAGNQFNREMALLQLLGGTGFGSPVAGGGTSQALAGQIAGQGAAIGPAIGGAGAALPFLFPPQSPTPDITQLFPAGVIPPGFPA